jgi:ATP-dependent Zn protease
MAAEEVYFGEAGTGPASDLLAATTLAAQMVGAFGMGSQLVSYEAVGNGPYTASNIVAKVLSAEDAKREMEDLLHRSKDQVLYLLEKNRDLVDALRDALLEHEELLGDEIAEVIDRALAARAAPAPTA